MNSESKKQRRQERREQKQKEASRGRTMRKARTWGIGILIIAAAIIAGGVWWLRLSVNPETFSVTGSCVTHGILAMHEHPHLSIVINDEEQKIPANVGILGTCLRPVHTHDDSGALHLEAPMKRDFTLGEFFQVWDKPFGRTQILDAATDDSHRIVVTVDGQRVDTYENTIVRNGQRVEIRYEAIADTESGS